MRKLSKKTVVLLLFIVAVAFCALFMFRKAHPPALHAKCASMEVIGFAEPSLQENISESTDIAIGTYTYVNGGESIFNAHKILKGTSIKLNSLSRICPYEVAPDGLKSGSEVIVFFDGKDGDYWSQAYPYSGIKPVVNGHIEINKKDYSMQEVYDATKKGIR